MSMVEEVRKYVKDNFERFGVNKQKELIRLIFEIAKRDDRDFKSIFPPDLLDSHNYEQIKLFLLKKRYPLTYQLERSPRFSLTSLSIDPNNKKDLVHPGDNLPKEFIIEEAVKDTAIVKSLSRKFPHIPQSVIKSYKEYNESHDFDITVYNKRAERMFFIEEKFDHLLKCPCTSGRETCGYNILNLGFGCGFECIYCFLQSYSNSQGIVIPANIDDYFHILDKVNEPMRIGTGQFTDSLIYDHITGYSERLIEYFRQKPHLTLELKTKSDNIANLLELESAENIVISWSLNPQNVIDEAEYFTASLKQRFTAAKKCLDAGYRIGFHFDPIMYKEDWEEGYRDVVNRIFTQIDPKKISLISLGCLRMTPKQKQVIENRFPQNNILNGEFILGYDDKLRYPEGMRLDIYQKMLSWIRAYDEYVIVYLCMESPAIYKKITGKVTYRF